MTSVSHYNFWILIIGICNSLSPCIYCSGAVVPVPNSPLKKKRIWIAYYDLFIVNEWRHEDLECWISKFTWWINKLAKKKKKSNICEPSYPTIVVPLPIAIVSYWAAFRLDVPHCPVLLVTPFLIFSIVHCLLVFFICVIPCHLPSLPFVSVVGGWWMVSLWTLCTYTSVIHWWLLYGVIVANLHPYLVLSPLCLAFCVPWVLLPQLEQLRGSCQSVQRSVPFRLVIQPEWLRWQWSLELSQEVVGLQWKVSWQWWLRQRVQMEGPEINAPAGKTCWGWWGSECWW